MELQLSVRFQVTPDGHQVRLVAIGDLTETNQQVLYPLLHRAWALTSATEVVIDLTAVEHLETAALDLLCWEVEHHQRDHLTQSVRFTLPRTPPANGPPPPRAAPNPYCAPYCNALGEQHGGWPGASCTLARRKA